MTPVPLTCRPRVRELGELLAVEQVVAVRDALRAGVRVERELGPRRRAVLRRDDDDAVRAARAVDRRRRRVLQDLDRLDVVRVERRHRIRRHRRRRVTTAVARALVVRIVLDREAVDDVERLVVAGDRGAAAHANRQRAARRGRRLRHHHAGRRTLERLLERQHRRLLDVRRDRGDGAGEIGSALRAVADDDHLVERDRRGGHREVDRRGLAARERHELIGRRVADARRANALRAGGRRGDRELSVRARFGRPPRFRRRSR